MEIDVKGQEAVDAALLALNTRQPVIIFGHQFKVMGVSVHHARPKDLPSDDPRMRGYSGPQLTATVNFSHFPF